MRLLIQKKKMLEIYNSDIIKISFKDESRELIFKNGFTAFKEYFQSSDVNFETVLKGYKLIGIRAYIEQMKAFDVIASDKSIDYIVSFVISFMYMKYIKELAEEN